MKQKLLCFVLGVLAVATGSAVVLSPTVDAQDNRSEGVIGFADHRAGAVARMKHQPKTPVMHLTGTFFDVSGGGEVSCTFENCLATPFTMFSESVTCPGGKGTRCTFQITIAAQNQVGSNDLPANPGQDGAYQIFVDGVPPSPGPTDSLGFGGWSSMGQAASVIMSSSTALTANVTNTETNQAHSVVVNLDCQEILNDASGCFAQTGFDNLQIARYQP